MSYIMIEYNTIEYNTVWYKIMQSTNEQKPNCIVMQDNIMLIYYDILVFFYSILRIQCETMQCKLIQHNIIYD